MFVSVNDEININPRAQLGGALLVALAVSAVWLVADLLNLPPTITSYSSTGESGRTAPPQGREDEQHPVYM